MLAALLLGLSVFLTGGLHLDGLMDTVDGVYGGRSREERLAFMKDSHVGAFGVIAVVLVLILKYSLYTQLNCNLLPYLIAAPVLGRQVEVWAQVLFPYARQQGIGSLFSIYGNYKILMITTGISLFLLVTLLKLTGVGSFYRGRPVLLYHRRLALPLARRIDRGYLRSVVRTDGGGRAVDRSPAGRV